MSEKGWVYAYRNAWTHPAFNNLREAAIWNFLYQNAFWEDGERNFNGHTFSLKRGEIVVSVSFLAKGFCMTEKGVRVVIQKLEKQGMLVKRGANKGTIITICNYDAFQTIEETKGKQEGKRGANKGQTKGDNKKKLKKEETKEVNIIQKPESVSDEVWEDFVSHRKAKKAPLTETALKGIIRESNKAGFSLEEALSEICARGWVGFNSSWVEKKQRRRKDVYQGM